uniref:Uncharacterized protein n=1 Tax=Citrus x changshan-huyou TaxID=2935761 RepID=A0AAP0MLG5_9ROSI
MVKAATPLHKAMEYETCPNGGAPAKEDHQQKRRFFLTVTLESTNITATHSTRRWNMRPAEMEELLSRRTINIRASICDGYFGIYKHNWFAPAKYRTSL